MKPALKYAPALFFLLGLCSCVQRDMVMIIPTPNQTDQQALSKSIAAHCASTDGQKYLDATPIVGAGRINPEKAVTEHMNGCASVKFHINADGKATDVTVLHEFPDNYGYGASAVDSVKRSTYKAPASSDDWYFINTVTTFFKQ